MAAIARRSQANPRGFVPWLHAAAVWARAAAGLFAAGLAGGPAAIDRRTGRVRRLP
jgi:hypothetical protein